MLMYGDRFVRTVEPLKSECLYDFTLRTRRAGGYSEGSAPVPIPNTAVKPLSADGTMS